MRISGMFRIRSSRWSAPAGRVRRSTWPASPIRVSRSPRWSVAASTHDMTELTWLGPADGGAVLAAAELFDHPPTPEWTQEFLARQGHHLCLARVSGEPAGFVTGVEMPPPDQGTGL